MFSVTQKEDMERQNNRITSGGGSAVVLQLILSPRSSKDLGLTPGSFYVEFEFSTMYVGCSHSPEICIKVDTRH